MITPSAVFCRMDKGGINLFLTGSETIMDIIMLSARPIIFVITNKRMLVCVYEPGSHLPFWKIS